MQRIAPILIACVCSISQFPAPLMPVALAAPQQNPGAADRLSDADLEELLAPIALYPDPLLANVLAASCYPEEVAQAANADAATIDSSSWEPSVKAVAKIPDAIAMLKQYPDWTTALGEAFVLQSQDVMAAVQRLRARAYANGSLKTTPEQTVQAQGDTVVIQPAQPEVIYVPSYEPSVVYVDDDDGDEFAAGVIGFGLGITAGLIIGNNMDCDWHGGGCCYGCGGGWGHGDVDIDINNEFNRNTNINNIKNNGNKWKANNDKLSSNLRNGQPRAMNSYKGVGSGRAQGGNARVPNRQAGAKPIANRAAPKPSQVNRSAARPNQSAAAAQRPKAQPVNRPASMQRPTTPKAKPSIPPAANRPPARSAGSGGGSQFNRPSQSPGASRSPARQPSRPSAYGGGGGGSRAASRGAASRGGGGRGGRR